MSEKTIIEECEQSERSVSSSNTDQRIPEFANFAYSRVGNFMLLQFIIKEDRLGK